MNLNYSKKQHCYCFWSVHLGTLPWTLFESIWYDSWTSIFVFHDGEFCLFNVMLLFSTCRELFHVLELDLEGSKHWAAFHSCSCTFWRAHLGQLWVFFDPIRYNVALRSIGVQMLLIIDIDIAQRFHALNLLHYIPLTAILACNVSDNASLWGTWTRIIFLHLVSESRLLVWGAKTWCDNLRIILHLLDWEQGITVLDLDGIFFHSLVSWFSRSESHLSNINCLDWSKLQVFVAPERPRMLAWRIFWGKWAPSVKGIDHFFASLFFRSSDKCLKWSKLLVDGGLVLVELSIQSAILGHQVLDCPFVRFNFLHVIDYFVRISLYHARGMFDYLIKFIQAKSLTGAVVHCGLRQGRLKHFLAGSN